MNRSGLWLVTVVVAAWIGFLLGYAMSAHTGTKSAAGAQAVTGGYGKLPAKKPAPPGAAETPGGAGK